MTNAANIRGAASSSGFAAGTESPWVGAAGVYATGFGPGTFKRGTAVTGAAAVGTDGVWIRADVGVFASVGPPVADERAAAALSAGAVGADGVWVAASGRRGWT